MLWHERWRTVAARMEGLVRAGKLAASAFKVTSSDTFDVVRRAILPELDAIKTDLHQFQSTYGAALPPAAAASLKRFLEKDWRATGAHPSSDIQVVIPIAVFRTEFDALLRDSEQHARSRTELAFEHLRRSLAVDSDLQRRWQEAFAKREEHCERLGAVHLLSHGIWAFKVSAAAAATDLVFGEAISDDIDFVRRTAQALVLTEWKVVRTAAEMDAKSSEARRQTRTYASGVLGDLELKRTRFIVLVTDESHPVPADVLEEGVTFKHVVVHVNPKTASQEARVSNQGAA